MMPSYDQAKHISFITQKHRSNILLAFLSLFVISLSGCLSILSTPSSNTQTEQPVDQSGDSFLIVDCLLPGQVRKLGANMTFLTPRRPIKTSTSDCEIRGGEYVSYDRANYSTALKIWLPLAKEGDMEAQTYVGEIYEKGLGILPDYAFAAEWYSRAAVQGYARAQINLGHLYENGNGVPKDLTQALNLYRQASGLTGDNLQFASTLTASYVPRQTYETTQQELLEQLQKNENLEESLDKTKAALDDKVVSLKAAENKLRETSNKLQATLAISEKTLVPVPVVAGVPTPVPTPVIIRSDKSREYRNRIKQLEKQEQSLKTKITDLEKGNQTLAKNQWDLESKIEVNKRREMEQQNQLQSITSNLNKTEQQFNLSKQQIASLSNELDQVRRQADSAEKSNRIKILEKSLTEKNVSLTDQQEQYKLLTNSNKAQLLRIKKALDSLKAQSTLLTDRAERHKTQKDELGKSLVHQMRQANAVKNQLLQKRAEFQLLRVDHQRALKEVDEKNRVNLDQQANRIKQLLAQLDEQQQLVNEQTVVISSLETERDQYSNDMLQLAGTSVENEPPSIEIIEPPVILTRSVATVTLNSKQDIRQIIGKVMAPAGLLSFNINGKPESVGDNQLFQALVNIMGENTPVEVVAVDNLGRRVAVNFTILLKPDDSLQLASSSLEQKSGFSPSAYQKVKFGNYYALVIGNNAYYHLSTLATAINDATETAGILENKYGFNATLLLNAKRYEILSELNRLRQTLRPEDNLLIYYAGHGRLEKANSRGYWLPVDAEADNSTNWISNTAITDIINTMKAKHILVVADSCYSGTLTQTSLARMETELSDEARYEWIRVMSETKARITMTSGGLEPVLDGGGGKHSIFSKAFIEALQSNSDILEGYSLYHQVLSKVTQTPDQIGRPAGSSQIPQYGPIHMAGHESGEFFFYPI